MSTLKLQRLIPDLCCEMHNCHFHQVDFRERCKMVGKRLYPEYVKIKGEVQTVNWWAEASVNPDGSMAYDDLIVREAFTYTRDPNGFALYRDSTLTWICEDETDHPDVKTLEKKFYPPLERIQERKTRRTNIIDDLKLTLLAWVAISTPCDFVTALGLGQTFFTSLQSEIAAYIELSNDVLAIAITNDSTTTWLDNQIQGVTIRALVLDAIDI